MPAEQREKEKRTRTPGGAAQDRVGPNPETIEKGKKLKEDMDALMDEIDDVLEENAEEFVRNYVQQGGE